MGESKRLVLEGKFSGKGDLIEEIVFKNWGKFKDIVIINYFGEGKKGNEKV